MWEIYGEGGGQFNNLKDAREQAKEFSKVGNDYEGYTGKPGEVSIWKDGSIYFTYKNGKVFFDGWTLKKTYYKVLNLVTKEEEEILTNNQKLKVGSVYILSDERRVKVLEEIKGKSQDKRYKGEVEPPKGTTTTNNSDKEDKIEGTNDEDINEQAKTTKCELNKKMGLTEAMKTHSKLNSNLFDLNSVGGEYKMHKEVRIRLCEIADMFVESIQEDNIPIKVYDYWLVGSNAAYNYTPDSDIDVHIIVDMEDIGVNPYIIKVLYDYVKSNFNDKYDIMVKGHEVELYLEDIKTGAITNGIYSLKQDRWIKVPEPKEDKDYYIEDTKLYDHIYRKFMDLEDSEAEQFLDDLYILRKESLASDGEFGEGNLIFKQFRNNGYIDQLKEMKYRFKSEEMTLESFSQLEEYNNEQWRGRN